jgi:hypothetical protein
MNNLHLIPTDKPSRLYISINGRLYLHKEPVIDMDIRGKNQNIYITNGLEIKEGDYAYYMAGFMVQKVQLGINVSTLKAHKKIILTTDQDLIKDGVQAIDDEFLEWFVKNPSCEEVEIIMENYYASGALQPNLWRPKIIIPKEEPKQETTLEEVAEKYVENFAMSVKSARQIGFIDGAKWQQQNSYSEVEVLKLLLSCKDKFGGSGLEDYVYDSQVKDWFKKFKKK